MSFNKLLLTDAELELLRKVVADHSDDGPLNAGWQSDELLSLIKTIDRQAETKR